MVSDGFSQFAVTRVLLFLVGRFFALGGNA